MAMFNFSRLLLIFTFSVISCKSTSVEWEKINKEYAERLAKSHFYSEIEPTDEQAKARLAVIQIGIFSFFYHLSVYDDRDSNGNLLPYRFGNALTVPPTYKLSRFPLPNDYFDFLNRILILENDLPKVDFKPLSQINIVPNKPFIFDINFGRNGHYVPGFLGIGSSHTPPSTCEWNKKKFVFTPKEGKDYLIIIGAIDSRSNEKGYVCQFSLEEWNENTKQYQNFKLTDYPEK